MKIAVFHPQTKNFGGGEVVALTVAEHLSKKNEVDLFTRSPEDKKPLMDFFGIDVSKVSFKQFIESKICDMLPLSTRGYFTMNSVPKLLESYDLVIDTGTNGWFTKNLHLKSIAYIHFPFFFPKKTGVKSVINPFILDSKHAYNYNLILCNSKFTLDEVKLEVPDANLDVLYPPVETSVKPGKKEKIIVTVGRFSYEKKHEVLIEAFKKLNEPDWHLHIIGAFKESLALYNHDYVDKLKKMAQGYNIDLHFNMPHNQVMDFLAKSSIYWHARGFGETDKNEYENFGITTVEAMAAGCIPIVVNLGAQPEIVRDGIDGFTWNDIDELVSKTKNAIRPNVKKLNPIPRTKQYSKEEFCKSLDKFIDSLFS